MATKRKKLVDPVIIIPGITATNLRDEYPFLFLEIKLGGE